jgi:hypothetical protein
MNSLPFKGDFEAYALLGFCIAFRVASGAI